MRLLWVLSIAFLASCSSGSETEVRGAVYSSKKPELITSTWIGPAGGTIHVDLGQYLGHKDVQSLSLKFEPGALERRLEMKVFLDFGNLKPESGEWLGFVVSVEAENNLQNLQSPLYIQLSMPIADDELVIGYTVEDNGSLDSLDMAGRYPKKSRSDFATHRLGAFTFVKLRL